MNMKASWLVLAVGFGLVGCGKKSESTPQAAVQVLAQRTDDLPTDPEEKYKVTYVRAAQAFSRNDLESALKFLEMAEQSKSGQANTANLRGAIYTRQRDWPKAQSALKRLSGCNPTYPWRSSILGRFFS